MIIEAPEITDDHFRKASEKIISWANEQELDKAIEDCAAWPPKMFDKEPIKHGLTPTGSKYPKVEKLATRGYGSIQM